MATRLPHCSPVKASSTNSATVGPTSSCRHGWRYRRPATADWTHGPSLGAGISWFTVTRSCSHLRFLPVAEVVRSVSETDAVRPRSDLFDEVFLRQPKSGAVETLWFAATGADDHGDLCRRTADRAAVGCGGRRFPRWGTTHIDGRPATAAGSRPRAEPERSHRPDDRPGSPAFSTTAALRPLNQ